MTLHQSIATLERLVAQHDTNCARYVVELIAHQEELDGKPWHVEQWHSPEQVGWYIQARQEAALKRTVERRRTP